MKGAVSKGWLRDSAGYEAFFRLSVVSKVEARVLGGERLSDAIHAVAKMRHITRHGVEVTVSLRSVYRWTNLHRERGLLGLGLHEVIVRYGFMTIIYLDNAAGFTSDDTRQIIGSLGGVSLINGTSGYPEGHGKIERFNQTSISAVLRGLDGAADVDPSPSALTLRLQHYLSVYNQRPHESLDGETPEARWSSDPRPLRMPENRSSLDEQFILTETRVVSKDHIIRLEGGEFEVPRGRAQESISVRRHALTGALSVIHDGKVVHIHPVDKYQNAVERRAHLKDEKPIPTEGVPSTATKLAFERDYGPMVGPDGGFSKNKE